MTKFIQGEIVEEFQTKKGKKAVIRYPKLEDLDVLTAYINKLSKEDTFITFSGEEVTKDQEEKFLKSEFEKMELGDEVFLLVFINDMLAGVASVLRDLHGKKRSYHVGVFGITVSVDFRGEGIGLELAKTVFEQAKSKIEGLRIVELDVYGKNNIAQNMYKKLGFKEFGRLPKGISYKGEYIDRISMYLEL